MMELSANVSYDENPTPHLGSQAPIWRFERLAPFTARIGLLDGGVNVDWPRPRESGPEDAMFDTVGRSRALQGPIGASLPTIRRELAKIWRLVLASQIDEALCMIEQLELRFDDVPPANA
jgi:hypothetical protein